MKILSRMYKVLLLGLPVALYFSYYPVISLGANETMNLELSLALVWLVLLDVCGGVLVVKRHLLRGLKKGDVKRMVLLLSFPFFVTVSAFWSHNLLRGVLTAGIMWLIIIAGVAAVKLAPLEVDTKVRRTWLRVWMIGTLIMCAWCIGQCVLDLVGCSREQTLLCAGCTYKMFGFPHPNGFAIEPQFMGNLLLAPVIVVAWMLLRKPLNARFLWGCLIVTSVTLFLTFSRGAIYALMVAMLFMTAFWLMKERKKDRTNRWGPVKVWGAIILSFVMALNVQGLMAAVSPTNDTYQSGVAKVINHLSLGIVDIREKVAKNDGVEVVEKPVENYEEKPVENSVQEEAVFDGYVQESTDTRIRLTDAALSVWSRDLKTVLIGVGLGGAGEALFENGLSPSPKEIVQNEYASMLLETGLIGVGLGIVALAVLMIWAIRRWPSKVLLMLTLLVAYAVSLCFFSGLPNALQVYLMPVLILVMI